MLEYFVIKIMSYCFNYDLSKLPRDFFRDVAKIVNKKKLHKKFGETSRNIVRKFKIDKILGIQLEDAISVVEDLTDIYIKNLIYQESFKKAKRKILLIPHCCRKYMDSRCKAKFDPEYSSYFCGNCSKDCLANKATKLGKAKGYMVFIVPGGSCVKKILDKVDCDGVLGIACPEELKLGINLVESRGLSVRVVPLIKNGCSNTKFSLESLRKALM
ncbi:MAG: hypothetical protein DRP10_04235 [Candidatus Aenigmatarchaeota archaeon]|nr:MAG: hypothetical protein DRP10_04235 [Candidatus Aenigmarchaeota archaeon]